MEMAEVNSQIIVSVIMPVYNEENYIKNCIESLLMQDYPKENMEWIFVDGNSKDNTKKIISEYADNYPDLIKVLDNPDKIVPYAMNAGIKSSKGKYIVRLDAHADYANDYISKCVYYLENTDAENVGGVAETKAEGFVGITISKMLSSKFGVGNSQFRTNGKSGYVDTVPFGAFRREVFEKIGLFNTKLIRSEDNDINARIRKNGGKIYLSSDIKFTYYCRDTVKGLLKMGLQNGNALFRTLFINPSAMSLRHFIPFMFFLSVIILPVLSIFFPFFLWVFLAEITLYSILDIYFSFSKNSFKCGLFSILLFPLFHLCYGLGSFLGIFGIRLY